MNKLKSMDLPDPPTYDSILKSTVRYKVRQFSTLFYKKSRASLTCFSDKTKKRIQEVKNKIRLNIKKSQNNLKKTLKKISSNQKKISKKIIINLKQKTALVDSSIKDKKKSLIRIYKKISSYDWERIIFTTSFSLIILFLMFSFTPFLIADNDNLTYLCYNGDGVDCNNASDCDITAYGWSQDACNLDCPNWNIGGSGDSDGYPIGGATGCCGDDTSENYVYYNINETTLESGSDNTADDACCDVATDCVYSEQCYTHGVSVSSLDIDSDSDVCLNGEWVDCNSDSDCSYGFICNTTGHDCKKVLSNIDIRNLGTTGIENTSQEFTSTKNVVLNLNFSEDAVKCRYTNYANNSEVPAQDYIGWTLWESCISNRIWTLTDNAGVKTVFYQIEYPIATVTVNDTINYNYGGYGLDLTPPSTPHVYHNNYTNDNQYITIYWDNSTDLESSMFGIPLIYNVSLFNQSGILIANISTTNSQYTFDIVETARQSHGVKLYADVLVINSANLTSSSSSNDLVIDLIGPNMTLVYGEAFNFSSGYYEEILNEDSWFYSNNVNLSWTAFDTNSSIYAYSYNLNKGSYKKPDNVPEGTIDQLHELIDTIYSNLDSGKYYFTIKARDMAGNWGNESSINFSVDSTPPTTPVILTKTKTGKNYTFTWSASSDPESDITNYMLILNASGIRVNATINDTDTRSFTFGNLEIDGEYNITAGALNGAGIWSWDEIGRLRIDNTPPEITAMPNTSVIKSYPILKAWTNEQAVCEYSLTSSPDEKTVFRYTNTSYHETKLNYSIDDDYDYTIACTDLSGNEATKDISFSVNSSVQPDDMIILSILDSYENTRKTINLKIVDLNGNQLSGLLNQDFNLKLNNKNHAYSVFDYGNGYYNLSFDTPDYGSYDMLIKLFNNIENVSILNISKLGFNVIYNDSDKISISDYDSHLSYAISDTNIGLATEDDLEPGYEITSQNNKLNISGSDIKNSIMIFNTKAGVSLDDRNKKIDTTQFLNLVNPSFGYPISEEYYILYKLAYKDYDIKGDDKLNHGKYDISILNTVEDDKTVIKFEKTTDNDKVVLTSG